MGHALAPSINDIDCITFSPIKTPLELRVGTNNTAPEYLELLNEIAAKHEHFSIGENTVGREYCAIDQDVHRLSLFTWVDKEASWPIRFHVFPNQIAIVEIELNHLSISPELEATVQSNSQQQIFASWPRFTRALNHLQQTLTSRLLSFRPEIAKKSARIFWTSRALLLQRSQLKDIEFQACIKNWLSDTQHPSDADAIIKGDKDESLTWLNYLVVNPENDDYRKDAMILAQYCYTAQEVCNQQLKEAISAAYLNGEFIKAQSKLSQSQITARMHQITFQEHIKYLTRRKKELLLQILDSWDYAELTDNTNRMIDVCSARLKEANEKKRERSSSLTGLLLGALSFFTIFEISIYLTEFSREVISRPMLDLYDEEPSLLLSFIASQDLDVILGTGISITVLFTLLFLFLKKP